MDNINKLEALDKKVDRLISYLHNDDGTGELGLIADFKEHKKQMTKFVIDYETEKKIRSAKTKQLAVIFSSIGTLVSYCFGLFVEWVYNLKK